MRTWDMILMFIFYLMVILGTIESIGVLVAWGLTLQLLIFFKIGIVDKFWDGLGK